MGKAKLRAMLARDGLALSVSTVGRILSRAIADGRIKPASFCEGRAKPKRRRSFGDAWANQWRHGDRARGPGEMLQIDHMTYSRDGRALKEVPADSASPAVRTVTRFMAARVLSRATAGNAKRFLEAVLKAMPFPVRSIQVDGGSEFMRHEWRPTSSAPARRWASHCAKRSFTMTNLRFACASCRREGPSGDVGPPKGGASSAPTGPPASSSGASTTDPSPSPTSPQGSPGTSSSTTTGGRTGRLPCRTPNESLVGIEDAA